MGAQQRVLEPLRRVGASGRGLGVVDERKGHEEHAAGEAIRVALQPRQWGGTLYGMGLLATKWEAMYEGHKLVVSRNEIGRGFQLDWDGVEIARRQWSFFGLGELHGSAEIDGRHVDVRVALQWAGFSELDGKCTITVDGSEIPVRKVK